MIISYKYRAYPDATTETRLNAALDTCRWLYNKLLEESNTARESGITPTMRGTQGRIVTLKDEKSGTERSLLQSAPDGELYPLE